MLVAVVHNEIGPNDPPEDQDLLCEVQGVAEALRGLGHEAVILPCSLDLAAMCRRLAELKPQAVFNLVESLAGDDSLAILAPAVFEALRVPYTGNTATGIFLTSHKLLAKERLWQAGLPTPQWIAPSGAGRWPATCESASGLPNAVRQRPQTRRTGLHDSQSPGSPDLVTEVPLLDCPESAGDCTGHLPADQPADWIIKGIFEQGSRNIDDQAVVRGVDLAGIRHRLQQHTARLGRHCYAERYIDGREIVVGLLAGPEGMETLPPLEILFCDYPPDKPRIVGYQSKWLPESFEYDHTPRRFDFPPTDQAMLDRLRQLALRCVELFGLRGYARVDFRIDSSGQPWILEVNPNPCLTPEAGFYCTVEYAGIGYAGAIGRILDAAATG